MLKKLLLLPLFILLNGCFTNNYYVLSTASQPTQHYARNNRVIGVEKVIVPKYLFKREIAVAQSASHIDFLSGAVWAEDLDAGLTQRLIGFLQKKFNQPNVFAYPWGVNTQPGVKIKVQITRFIAQGERVYLDANWEAENMHTHTRKARLFSTSVATNSDASSIVDAMDRAFGELERDVAKGIR
jgi:cholesterol transport system auxiliary component